MIYPPQWLNSGSAQNKTCSTPTLSRLVLAGCGKFTQDDRFLAF
jgi:hypothetical protein